MSKFTKIFSLVLIFFFFSTYSPSDNDNDRSLIFPIKKIIIEGNNIVNKNTLLRKLQNIYGKSLFFLNTNQIKDAIFNINFISTVKIKKIYPNVIKLIISEKKPIAIFINKKNKFYILEKKGLLKYIYLEDYKDLPNVFNFDKSFYALYRSLNKVNFPVNEIRSYYYFKINRWDIILKSNKVIKLPAKNYIKSLENFMSLVTKSNFDTYNNFDYRIKNQLIINE